MQSSGEEQGIKDFFKKKIVVEQEVKKTHQKKSPKLSIWKVKFLPASLPFIPTIQWRKVSNPILDAILSYLNVPLHSAVITHHSKWTSFSTFTIFKFTYPSHQIVTKVSLLPVNKIQSLMFWNRICLNLAKAELLLIVKKQREGRLNSPHWNCTRSSFGEFESATGSGVPPSSRLSKALSSSPLFLQLWQIAPILYAMYFLPACLRKAYFDF